MLFSLVAGSMGGCQPPEEVAVVAAKQEPLYVDSAQIWPLPRHIGVCWQDAGNDQEKGWVRDQVAATWERATGVVFTGWGGCTAGAPGLHIHTIDDVNRGPRTRFFGRRNDTLDDGMLLNFWFQHWIPVPCGSREACIRSIGVHEFGHALGFAHEQNRPDTVDLACANRRQGDDGNTLATPWDALSVMNYCNPTSNNGGVLSANDIAGARIYYGTPVNRCRYLTSNQYFKRGQQLSACGLGSLVFATNGNLVLLGPSGQQTWSSGTAGSDADLAIMQPDGNFVLYGARGTALWSTGTYNFAGSELAMQNDGNLVVYDSRGNARWVSNTRLPAPRVCRHMHPNEAIERGQRLVSCGGNLVLTLQTNGDLVLLQDGSRMLWHSNTADSDAYAAIMQPDGNLVLYGWNDNALWKSNTAGNPGAHLELQNDNNLVVYASDHSRALWASNSEAFPPNRCRDMVANQVLRRGGQSLRSCNGTLALTLQSDGNLVLSDGAQALWASNTYGSDAYAAMMQTDGNLVIYGAADNPLWASGTPGNPGARLSLQNDGNLVLYNSAGAVRWTANSYYRPPGSCRTMWARQGLGRGQSISSCNGRQTLTMQSDGNLVLYRDRGRALWASNTYGSGAYTAQMQPDGNLVLYRLSDDAAVWSTGTSSSPMARLDVQDDGNLVIYDVWGTARFASNTVVPPDSCGGTVCGTLCCQGDAWCGVGNRCCTGCSAGCPC